MQNAPEKQRRQSRFIVVFHILPFANTRVGLNNIGTVGPFHKREQAVEWARKNMVGDWVVNHIRNADFPERDPRGEEA